jgi:hypothetical protein
VEHIWDEIREKWFANEVFNSLDAVEDRLVEALVALENDRELVASTTGSIGLLIAGRLQLSIRLRTAVRSRNFGRITTGCRIISASGS